MDREKIAFAWWYYFWLITALSIASLFFIQGWLDALHVLAGVPALVGLWAYLRKRRVLHRYFWAAYFLYNVGVGIWDVVATVSDSGEAFQVFGATAWLLFALMALVTALMFPLYLALWRYAFRSPQIWHVAA